MKATGIVRRVDDLGRVVIPKEIRRTMSIREGDPLEIFVDPKERAICFKSYLLYSEPWRQLEDVADMLTENDDFRVFRKDILELVKKMKDSQK